MLSQAVEILFSALNQNLIQFELKPGVEVIVYVTQLTLGKEKPFFSYEGEKDPCYLVSHNGEKRVVFSFYSKPGQHIGQVSTALPEHPQSTRWKILRYVSF